MSTITAIILARNEEQHIADCIKSIQCADEILVIDDGSTDRTVEIAETLDAKVIPHALAFPPSPLPMPVMWRATHAAHAGC